MIRLRMLLTLSSLLSLLGCSVDTVQPERSTIRYEVVSTSPETSQKLPMIVALHFMGGSIETSREDYTDISAPARIALLQGEFEIDGGFSWFPEGYYEMSSAEQNLVTRQIAERVSAVLAELSQEYATEGLPIVTGYSQGADIAHLLALHHGSRVSAIIPMGARFENEWTESADEVSLFQGPAIMFHGNADEAVSITHSRAAVAFYSSNGIPARLEEFDGVGHAYPAEMKAMYQDSIEMILGHSEAGH